MAVELATGYVSIIPSMQGVQGALASGLSAAAGPAAAAGDQAGGRFSAGFGSKVKNLAGAAGLTIGVAGTVRLIQDTIGAASDLGETVNKSNVIFGDNAAAMDAWAQGAARSAGLSRGAALDVATGFGNMFSQLGFAGDEAASMSQGVVQLSADLGSFNNLPTAEVADMMSAAFRGEFDSLQRLIPNINAARVEQEALAATGKASAKELTAQEKAAATLAIVQRDGAAAAGDFARTSDGLANSSKILGAQMGNIQAQLGAALVPAMTAAVTVGSELITFFTSGSTAAQVVMGVIAGLTAVLVIHSTATRAVAAAHRIAAVTTGIVTAAQWLWNAALTANPIGIVVVAIAALVGALIYAWHNSETFRAVVTGAWEGIKAAAMAVGNWFTVTVPAWWRGVLTSTRATFGAVMAFLSGVWSGIQSGARSALDFIVRVFSYTPIGMVVTNFGAIVDFFRNLPGRIRDALGNVGELLLEAGGRIMDGLARGIRNAVGKVTGAVSNAMQAVRDFLPGSPAKRGPLAGRGWSFYSGESVSTDFARGMASQRSKVAGAAGDVMGAVTLGEAPLAGVPRRGPRPGAGGDTINVYGHYWTAEEVAEAMRNAKRDRQAVHGLTAIAVGV